ncbi:unnamed protein product [Urochloa humidicola]
MEFERPSVNHWETDYEAIRSKFRDAAVRVLEPAGLTLHARDVDAAWVAMVSGFSKSFVKLFLENDGMVNPEAVMNAAITGEEYHKARRLE